MTPTQQKLPHRPTISTAILAAAAVAGLLLCFLLSVPFLSPLVWSFTLAVLLAPAEAWLRRRMPFAGPSAAIVVALVALLLVVPSFMLTGAILQEAGRGAGLIRGLAQSERWAQALDRWPWLARARDLVNEQVDLEGLGTAATSWIAGWSGTFVKVSFSGALTLLLTFYFLFYLLRDRETIRAAVARALPLTEPEFAALSKRVAETVSATAFGIVAVAALQGALGGVMFWWLGLPAPLFWGLVMSVLAVVPFLGAFVIWGPAALVLALTGQPGAAAILAIWGAVVIGMADNLVRPMLVGSRLRLHSMVSFIALAGGLLLFGAPGIIVGTLAVTVSLTLLDILRGRLSRARLSGAAQPASDSPAGAQGRAGMAIST